MNKEEAKAIEQYGEEPAHKPRDNNRPNEDRPPIVRTKSVEHSEIYRWIKERRPQNYAVWDARGGLRWRILPLEQKHRACCRRMALESGAFLTLLPEIYGEKGNQLMDSVFHATARIDYETGKARGLIKDGAGVKEVAAFILGVYEIMGYEPSVLAEVSDERVRAHVFGGVAQVCIYGVCRGDYRMCHNTSGYEWEITKLINPKLRGINDKSLGMGDYACELCVEIDTGEWPVVEIKERPPIVRPELEHSEVYKAVVLGEKATPPGRPALRWRHVPIDERVVACARRWASEAGGLRTMTAEFFGEEGYQLIEDIYSSFAPAEYRWGMSKGLIKDPDQMGVKEVASYICAAYDIIGRAPLTIAECSDERVRIQFFQELNELSCPYWTRKGDWRMCVAEANFERDLTKLMNPKLRAYRTKGKAYGDYCCELTIDWDPEFR